MGSVLEGGCRAMLDRYPFITCTNNNQVHQVTGNVSSVQWYPCEITEKFLYVGTPAHAQHAQYLADLGIGLILFVGTVQAAEAQAHKSIDQSEVKTSSSTSAQL